MRVLITVSNWQGHYCALVPTAWALQAAGHEVRVACVPAQAETIARAGLTPVPVLDGLDMMLLARTMMYLEAAQGRRTAPGLPVHPITGAELHRLDSFDFTAMREDLKNDKLSAIRRSFDAVVELARSWRPDLVLHEPMSPEGALAARVTGVPSVLHLWGPGGVRERHPALFLGPPDPTGSFDRYGVGPYQRETDYAIDPSPASLEPDIGEAMRLPVRYIPYNGAGPIPEGLDPVPGRRRVCIIWGRSATGMFGLHASALAKAIEAVSALDVDVVVTTTPVEIEALGSALPPRVRVFATAPLRHLLVGADMVMHHGSANCSMTAGVLGVPQLSLAMSGEQIAISERFDTTGVSRTLPGQAVTPEQISAASRDILGDPSYRTAARRLREQMLDRPTPAQVARQLEDLAGAGVPARPVAVPAGGLLN